MEHGTGKDGSQITVRRRPGAAVVVAASLLIMSAAQAAPSWTLLAETWAMPRSGATVATMAPLSEAVQALLTAADTQLVLRHPAREEGLLWAEELRGWLIALGVPSARLALEAGDATAENLQLVVRRNQDEQETQRKK